MNMNWFLGVVMLSMAAGAGCGSVVTNGAGDDADSSSGKTGGGSGDAGSDEECLLPTLQESFKIVECHASPYEQPSVVSIDGAFETVSGGYRIVGDTKAVTVQVDGKTPAITAGTFVHMTYTCTPGYRQGSSYFVALQNLPTFAGKENPTEEGERLWFAASTGKVITLPIGDALPFTISLDSAACELYSYTPEGSYEPQMGAIGKLVVEGDGSSVSIAPEKEGEVTVPSGVHAGKYRILNDYTSIEVSGPVGIYQGTFTVSRAD